MNLLHKIKSFFIKSELEKQIEQCFHDYINRTIHKILTTEILDKTSDDNLIEVIHDNLEAKLPEDYSDTYNFIINKFNTSQQAMYLIWWLEAEINNGGFNQYYTNSTGEYAAFLPELLQLIGANKFSELTKRAHQKYSKKNDKIIAKQDGSLEGFCESYEDNPLNEFDDEFYDLYQTENINQLQIDFIRNNAIDFVA